MPERHTGAFKLIKSPVMKNHAGALWFISRTIRNAVSTT